MRRGIRGLRVGLSIGRSKFQIQAELKHFSRLRLQFRPLLNSSIKRVCWNCQREEQEAKEGLTTINHYSKLRKINFPILRAHRLGKYPSVLKSISLVSVFHISSAALSWSVNPSTWYWFYIIRILKEYALSYISQPFTLILDLAYLSLDCIALIAS